TASDTSPAHLDRLVAPRALHPFPTRRSSDLELAEELRAAQIDLIAGAVIDRLQDRDEHPESQSQRHHPEVVDGGDSELPPSDEDWIQIHGISVRVRTLFLR